jgi:hypothetical protein
MFQKPLLSMITEKMKRANRRLIFGLICYLALLGTALYVLLPVRTKEEGYLLGFVLFIFTLLIFKTLIHARDGNME